MRDKTGSSAPNDFITATSANTPTRAGRIGPRAIVATLIACGIAASLLCCTTTVGHATRTVMFVNFDSERGRAVFSRFEAACQAIGLQERHDVALRFVGADVTHPEVLRRAMQSQLRPDTAAIVAPTAPVVLEAMRLTDTIPIIFVTHQDPVDLKVTTSLVQRPPNLAGISYHLGVEHKMLELLREAAPTARRIGFIVDVDEAQRPRIREFMGDTARRHHVEWKVVPVDSLAGLPRALSSAGPVDAWFVTKLSILDENRGAFVSTLAATRRPVIYPSQFEVIAGGAMSYEAAFEDSYGALASQLDRALSGVKPGDIPIERPKRFTLAVNVKAARAAGMHLPAHLLSRADRVL